MTTFQQQIVAECLFTGSCRCGNLHTSSVGHLLQSLNSLGTRTVQFILGFSKRQQDFCIAEHGLGCLCSPVGKLRVHKLDGYRSHHPILTVHALTIRIVILTEYHILTGIVRLKCIVEFPPHAIGFPPREISILCAADIRSSLVVIATLEVVRKRFRHVIVVRCSVGRHSPDELIIDGRSEHALIAVKQSVAHAHQRLCRSLGLLPVLLMHVKTKFDAICYCL